MKAFADSTRLRILWALLKGEELCVCDLAAVLGMKISTVSQQLRLLRHHNLVRYRREGKMVYYSLDDIHISQILGVGLDHIKE
jgi:ArsR family transcriptional regulator